MMCADDDRGRIRSIERYRQPVCFHGLKFGKITPTDVDGLIEYRNQVFVFYELKLCGTEMPEGQRKALSRIVDALQSAGKHAVLMKCEHDVYDTDEQVDASEAVVTEIYWKGAWFVIKGGPSARDATDVYFASLSKKHGIGTPLSEADI